MSIVFDSSFQVMDSCLPGERLVKIKCNVVEEDMVEIIVGSHDRNANHIGIRSITDGNDDEGSFVFMSPETFDEVVAAVNKIQKEMK